MEFLKALQEAKSNGVDVDTFTLIWKLELEGKFLSESQGSYLTSSPGQDPCSVVDSASQTCESNQPISDPQIPSVDESLVCVTSELSSLRHFCQDLAADVSSLKMVCQAVSLQQQTLADLCKQVTSHLDKAKGMYEAVSSDTKQVKELCSKIDRGTNSYKETITKVSSKAQSTKDMCSNIAVQQKDMISQYKGIASDQQSIKNGFTSLCQSQRSLMEKCDQSLAGQKEMKEIFQKERSQPQPGQETPNKMSPGDTLDCSIREQLKAAFQVVKDVEEKMLTWQQETATILFEQAATDRKSIQKTFLQFRSDVKALHSDFRAQQGQWSDVVSSCVRDVTRNEQSSLLDRLSQVENSLTDFSAQQEKVLMHGFEDLVKKPFKKMLDESKQFTKQLFEQANARPAAGRDSSGDCSQIHNAETNRLLRERKDHVTANVQSDSGKKSQSSNPMSLVYQGNHCHLRLFNIDQLVKTQFLVNGPRFQVAGLSFSFQLGFWEDSTLVLALKPTTENQFEQVKNWPLVLRVGFELINDVKTGDNTFLCQRVMRIPRKPSYHYHALWIDNVPKLRLFPDGEKDELWISGSVYYCGH